MAEERTKDDQKANWNKLRRGHAKKDRRRWCRGKEGVEHELVVVLHHSAVSFLIEAGRAPCYWYEVHRVVRVFDEKAPKGYRRVWETTGDWFYACNHVWQCKNCGKYLDPIDKEDCPDRAPQPRRTK